MSEGTANRAELSTPTDREIRVERVFDAPRDRVFAAYADPELLAQWWGSEGTASRVEEFDARPGGGWRAVIVDSDGGEQRFRGVFREVVAPERFAWTFEWEGMPGYVSVETSTFEDLGDRTKLVSVTVFHTREERDGMLESGMEGGMNESFARLDALLVG